MDMKRLFMLGLAAVVAQVSFAGEEADAFGKWRIGVGGAFNGGVRARIGARNVPVREVYGIPSGVSKEAAKANAEARIYDGGGFIKEGADPVMTTNWKAPVECVDVTTGEFNLYNAYQTISGPLSGHSSSDEYQYGVSIEVAREIWIHDEAEDHRWGVDFAVGFSYFFERDVYKASGMGQHGRYVTNFTQPAAVDDYRTHDDEPVGGMYGHGVYTGSSDPAIDLSGVGSPVDNHSGVYRCSASGDYRELEMLFTFRPWYEITDWWRVYGQIGVGVSWGEFDAKIYSDSASAHEDFDQWDVYGVAGIGTMFRYDRYDLSIDFIGRFFRDDLDVDGRYLSGDIERADWGFRVMLGFEF